MFSANKVDQANWSIKNERERGASTETGMLHIYIWTQQHLFPEQPRSPLAKLILLWIEIS